MVAVWFAVAEPATARGTSGSGTRLGTTICITVTSNARATPRMKAVPRMTSREIAPVRTEVNRTAAAIASIAWQAMSTRAPVVAVGHLPDDEKQQHRGDELDQSDKPEIERIAGQRIKLPADRHDEHLVAERDRQAREPEQHERPVAQDGVGMRGGHRRCGLPVVAAKRRRLVEPGGIEPPTSSLRTRRSPS